MAIIFDMQRMQTKLVLAMILIFVFTLLYLIVPRSHFGIAQKYKDKDDELTTYDILYYSILCQVGTDNHRVYPLSWVTKVMSMCQFILGYAILLI